MLILTGANRTLKKPKAEICAKTRKQKQESESRTATEINRKPCLCLCHLLRARENEEQATNHSMADKKTQRRRGRRCGKGNRKRSEKRR